MLTVSDELKNEFMKSERTIYVRIKIGNRTFDNDNVVSVEYDSGSLSGEVFAIGSTYSNSIKITFSELVEGLKELDEVSYEIGIKLSSGAIEYVPMGIFIINDAIGMDRNNNKTTIECMDRMIMMGGTYVSSLTYPAAIREVALEIANKSGLVVDSTSFERLSADKIAKSEGYNYREAIGLIAQFEAGFATFNRYGKLEIRTLTDPNFAIPPDNYFSKGLVKNEVFFRLGGISCVTDYSDTTIKSGNTAGNQVVLENRVMTKTLLDKIYQKIQTINYYPFSLNWQGNPVIEAGDWVEVEDLEGNKFKTPNLSYSLSFNGGLSAKSSAETTTQSDATYQYKSPLQQKLEWIYAQIDAAGGNLIYEGINEPTNPKEGDLWFKIIGPDKQILIFKKKADGTLFWEPQISTADINKVAEEVKKIIEQADEDRIKAEQDINQALLDAKKYTETKAQEFDNQLLIVNQNLVTAKNSADAAVLKADKAIEDVDFLKPDVATAKANAATAIQDAATATQNATTAIQNAQTALNSVTTLSQEVDVSITNINGELTRKVSQTTFNTLSGTVGTHTTQISQTQNALLSKAESSLVNTIKGTVDTHTTQIKVASDGLELKADSSLVNTINGTVNTHTGQISANSTAIAARLTSAQVDSLVAAKKYVNETTLNVTAKGLSTSITQVSTDLSNLEITDRNLIKYSNKFYGTGGSGAAGVTPSVTADGNLQVIAAAGNANYLNGFIPIANVMSEELKEGDKFTISFTMKSANSTGIPSIYVKPGMGYFPMKGTMGTEFSTVYYTGIWKTANAVAFHMGFSGLVGTFIIKDMKIQKGEKPTGWSPAIEDMATLEKFTTLEATVNGINTTVGTKANQTQVTQLATQVSTKVESATYNSKMTQLDSAINLRVVQGDVTAAILADKTVKDTRNDNQLPSWYNTNYPKQTVNEFKYSSTMAIPGFTANYGTLETKVIWNSTAGGVITQVFSSADGVFQRTSNAAYTAWLAWDKVAETGKLISQINVSTEGILLQGKRIQLDGDVTMTSVFVTNIKAKSLEAVYADIATLKTRVLTANVIDSTMINANTALITKLFATDANVQILTAKTAFINSVKAIDIAADRIATGNLNAANVNIINLNVSKIVGLNSSFIQSNWNAAVGGGVSIAGGGVVTTASDGAQTLLQNGVLYVKSKSGQGLGTIGAALDGNENLFSIDIVNNQSFTIRYQTATGSATYKDIIGYYDYLGTVVINNATQINGWLRMNGALDMQQSDILAARYITSGVFQTGSIGSILNDGNRIAMKGVSGVSLGVGGQVNGGFSRILWLDGGYIYAEKTLSMQGNSITNNSDRRMKKNIYTAQEDSLSAISRWTFVDYEWISPDKPAGRQFGLIAQDTPELAIYDQERDVYSIDSSRQMMMNSHAINQLNSKVVSMETVIDASNKLAIQAIGNSNSALTETEKLKIRVSELEQKIKQMESAT